MRFLFLFIGIILSVPVLAQNIGAKDALVADSAWIAKELKRMGLSKGFINEALKTYEPESFKATVSLNLLGFLVAPGQHMNHVTPQAARESAKFIKAHSEAFSKAKSKYGVSPAVISSLLWIETRHGDDTGNFHILSVYLHLLQVDRPAYRKELVQLALQKNQKTRQAQANEIPTTMAERTKKKSQWAREQLIALAAIRKSKSLDLKNLRGSYAGAFGLPQFIPSSYRDLARSFDSKAKPNLQKAADAIMSVANYLAKSGWDPKSRAAKIEALMKYNNSRDYAESILEISKRAQPLAAHTLDPRGLAAGTPN